MMAEKDNAQDGVETHGERQDKSLLEDSEADLFKTAIKECRILAREDIQN